MAPLGFVLVGPEKELNDFKLAVEGSKKAVGAMKVFFAHRAVDAVSQLQSCVTSCGKCTGMLMHDKFTATGKEEYSDVIRKVLRDKYPETPIVCWGNPKKGGEEGKNFHYAFHWTSADGQGDVPRVLTMLKNNEIVPEYKAKKGGKDSGRQSLDASPAAQRRKSVDGGSDSGGARRKSIDAAPPQASPLRRTSVEAGSSAGGAIRKSFDVGPHASPLRRTSLEGSRSPNTASPRSSMDMRGMSGMSGMGMSGMGMSGMGMTPMPPMMPMTGMGGMGMGMTPMTGMGMTPMLPMTGMGMTPMMPMTGMAPGGSFTGMGGVPSAYNPGMGSMGSYSAGGTAPMPMQAAPMQQAAPVAAFADDSSGGSNIQLIKALADEVSRLKVLVEEKRAAAAAAAQPAQPVGVVPGMGMGMMSTGYNPQ